MTRAAWLATGAIGAALIATQVATVPALVAGAAALLGLAVIVHVGGIALGRHRVAAVALAIGAALILLRAAIGAALAPAAPLHAAGQSPAQTAVHEAVVLSVGTPSGGQQRATVELRPPADPERIYAWLPRYPPVALGDVVRFTGQLEPAPTEGGFADYLARSGIGWTSKARSMERLGADGSPLAALEGVRRGAAELIARALPEPQAGLGAAMMIGLRDLVSRDVAADFRAAGLSHVVAISGWHISLLGAVVSGLFSGIGRRPRSAIVLLAIVSYSILAGASPSIMRAAVMASVVLLARESGRAGQAAAALALTCAAMLLADPQTVTDVGFQLSVAATAGLLVWSRRLHEWLAGRLPRQTPGWLLEALSVSLAAQAATLPLVLYHFGSLSLVAPLANLLVAPIVAPAMLLTVVGLAAGALIGLGLPAIVLAPVTLVGALGIGALTGIAHLAAGLPFATVQLPEPFSSLGAAASAVLILALARRRPVRGGAAPTAARLTAPRPSLPVHLTRNRLTLGGGTVSLCLLLILVNSARPDGRLHVTVLDIGQGDAILLQGPNGGRMLIDTGPDPDLLLTLLDERLPAWDRRLDLVVLTHPHEDHVAALALLLDRYRIGEIVEPGMLGPGPSDAAYRRRLTELGRQSRVVAAGDRLWLDGISLEVEWPQPGRVPLRPPDSGKVINSASIVLDLHFRMRRMLFTGDIEQEVDPQLLAAGIADPDGAPLDVLKVAHHGSRTATTDALVEQLDPRIAIISVGWGNPYGHPSPETVARLVDNGAQLFRTDIDGSVEISTDGTDLRAYAGGGRPHPDQPPPAPTPRIGFFPIPAQIGARRRLTYNRLHAYPHPRRGSGDPGLASAVGTPADPLLGRGRGGRFHLRRHGRARRCDRHVGRRGSRAAP